MNFDRRFAPELYLIAFGVAVSLVTRGSALVGLGFSVDDILYTAFANFDFKTLAHHSFMEGRFVLPFIDGLADALGVNLPRSPLICGLIFSACLSWSAVLLCQLWRVPLGSVSSYLMVAVFVAHPYFTDMFMWKLALFSAGVPFLICLYSLLLARRSWQAAALAALFFAFGLGWHQLPLPLCAAALLFVIVFDLLQPTQAKCLREDLRPLFVICAGTIVYAVLAKLAIRMEGSQSVLGRDTIILFSHPKLVIERIIELMRVMFVADPVISPLTRWIALLTVLLSGLLLWRGTPSKRTIFIGMFLLATFLSGLLATSLVALPLSWTPTLRALSAAAIPCAAVFALTSYWIETAKARGAAIALTALVTFAFAGKGNEMAMDQLRASARDRSTMSRIAARLEQLPGFANIQVVTFVGTRNAELARLNTAADISSGWGAYGSTLSSFATFFGQREYLVFLLNEITGYSLNYSLDKDYIERAQSACADRKFWPDTESVKAIDSHAIVCLSRPAERKAGRFDVP